MRLLVTANKFVTILQNLHFECPMKQSKTGVDNVAAMLSKFIYEIILDSMIEYDCSLL